MSSEKTKEQYPLSAGEVLRSEKDWWMPNSHVTPIKMKNGRILLAAEADFRGFAGEAISCYSYCVISCHGTSPVVIQVKSVEDFKREAYAYMYKKERISYWKEMKEGTLFGWSEDPRPYVE